MKVYYIYSPSSTFGQTDAGCHSSVGQERIVASVDTDATDSEIATFMKVADLMLNLVLSTDWDRKIPNRELSPKIDIPLPHTREGLFQAIKLARLRLPNDPYVAPRSWAQHRIQFGGEPELKGPSIHLDAANLAHQENLLDRR